MHELDPAMQLNLQSILLLPFESLHLRLILSFATSTAAAVSSFKSNASVNAPDVPPPDSPFRATRRNVTNLSVYC